MSWNNAEAMTAHPPQTPSLLTEQHQPDAGRNRAMETSAKATDANMVAVSCIIMNETSARE